MNREIPESEIRLRQVLTDATRLLDDLQAPWVVVGAFAADEYRAEHRTTTDADLLVAWNDSLPEMLEAAGFTLRIHRDEGETHLIRAQREGDALDLIIAGTPYQHLAIARARHGVLTVEDVLVHKVLAWRPKDRADIASILSTGIQFDREYVDHWVAEWDVADRWREAQTWR